MELSGSSGWLVDTSALLRLTEAGDPDLWLDRIERGLLSVSTLTLLEIGFSARKAQAMREDRELPPVSLMLRTHLTPRIEERALEVQQLLADEGHHRAPSLPDLMQSALAELEGLTVLHVDKDFDLIAGITQQSVERLELRA